MPSISTSGVCRDAVTSATSGEVRFYSDVGVVPASARSASGYRLYEVEVVARLDLGRTLRDLGLPLESIRALLNAQTSLPEVAAAHLEALDPDPDLAVTSRGAPRRGQDQHHT
jgi:DNA-binding transcriptional MerR regulator